MQRASTSTYAARARCASGSGIAVVGSDERCIIRRVVRGFRVIDTDWLLCREEHQGLASYDLLFVLQNRGASGR